MTGTSGRIAGAAVLTAALALSTAACGALTGGDKKAACDKLQATIQDASRKGMTQISDPSGLAQTYESTAKDLRQEGKDAGDDDVKKAAEHAASAFERLGAQVKSLIGSGSTTPQMPDTSGLISAGKELKTACES